MSLSRSFLFNLDNENSARSQNAAVYKWGFRLNSYRVKPVLSESKSLVSLFLYCLFFILYFCLLKNPLVFHAITTDYMVQFLVWWNVLLKICFINMWHNTLSYSELKTIRINFTFYRPQIKMKFDPSRLFAKLNWKSAFWCSFVNDRMIISPYQIHVVM